MATIKSYTDIEQSKKLAELLPLESADMIYRPIMDIDSMSNSGFLDTPDCFPFNDFKNNINKPLPCWSLSALLDILESELDGENGTTYQLHLYKAGTWWDITYDEIYDEACPIEVVAGEELVDVCVEMINELHKLNMI